jgi:hypothetical protein
MLKKMKSFFVKNRRSSRCFNSDSGWKLVGGREFYFRSHWEYRYALHLEFQKKHSIIREWEFEPQTFWFLSIKRGVRSYKPDFKITENDGKHHWVEVKGYYDAKSKTKLRRFRKYYPEETLYVVDASFFSRKPIPTASYWEQIQPRTCQENEATSPMHPLGVSTTAL